MATNIDNNGKILIAQHRERLLAEKERGSPLWAGYVNMLKTLESVFLSPKHWILEFLQNAEDASAKRFSIRIGQEMLTILNDGNIFEPNDFNAICDVNSRKLPSLGFRGYLGIGFKSIFRITNQIYIHSGDYHFGFDREHWRGIADHPGKSISQYPWEILPINVEPMALPDGYTTGFFVPFRGASGLSLLQDIEKFLTSDEFPKEVILLLKNVAAIEIQTSTASFNVSKESRRLDSLKVGEIEMATVKKIDASSKWVYESRYLVFRKKVTVKPEIQSDEETERVRRSDVKDREIGLVFALDVSGRPQTLSGKLAGVYSFLPVEGEQTGLPFGVFGDFIPQPGRDLINYSARWNEWMTGEVETFFQEVVKEQCATQKEWQLFCLDIRGPLKYAATGMPGDIFWKSRLRDPIERFLNSESLFIDEDGTLRMVSQLLVVDDLILEIVGKDILEKATGRKFADRIIKEKLRATSLNIYNILHLPLVWDALREVPNKLVALYRRLVDLSSNDIKGRGGQDTPLAQIVFVLGDDKQLYPPGQITMFGTELDHIPGFLRALIPQGGRALHPEIAKDAEAVQQLKKCGVTVVDGENIRNLVRNLLDTITGTQQCPPGWNYPDDVIRATLFLAAVEHFQVRRLVAHSGTMEEPQHLFVPGSVLDWAPLWQANLLPGFQPVHEKYLDAGWLAANGLTEDGLKLYLKNLGVHGFENDKDKPLIEAAAEAIAMKKLGEQGHKLAKVTQRDKLGYDFECKDHCNKVFEVKGMSQPRDETLPQSETNAAQQRQNDYILVFAYNLPSRPNAVGYKVVTNPATIWEPVEIARIAKDKWLKA